ncbi:hypothetical protein [Lewinella sp. LCG006]|uniref:hypothetical protein n=1 Tax=Lewinella sp. LCG006 TaxID=3231911 RepID=UPI00345F5FB0
MHKEDGKILAFGTFGAWLTCQFFLMTAAVFTTVLTIVILLVRKSSATKYAILLNPFVFLALINIGQGGVDYYQGNARIRSFGEPAPQFYNIDRQYRLARKSMGCTVTGTSMLGANTYNQTIRTLVSKFGFQKGAYQGVFPSEEEANKLLQENYSVRGSFMFQGDRHFELSYDGNDYRVPLEQRFGLTETTLGKQGLMNQPKILKLEEDCLLGQLSEDWIYVIDLEKSRILARYMVKDRGY